MKPSEQGSFFHSRFESKEWYATIKTYKNINISVFCMKPEAPEPVEMSPKSGMLWSKLTKT